MKKINQTLTKDTEIIDVTEEMKKRCYKKTKGYEDTIEKVEKKGSYYFITFSKDYTAFCEKERIARSVSEVQWFSRIAKEEKELNKTLNDYIKEFKENEIIFDGKTIPEFIDTEKSLKARQRKTKMSI